MGVPSDDEFKDYLRGLFEGYAIYFDRDRGPSTIIFYFVNDLDEVGRELEREGRLALTERGPASLRFRDEAAGVDIFLARRHAIIMGIAEARPGPKGS
ncbi:MAG TPA: hypothetical protein PLB91_03980 [Spirochaetales bacterium]|nr:hypothetical protein [Spirochaetales bacterium]HRY53460.1 hypothetical protein [Spirochaetia bacterium]